MPFGGYDLFGLYDDFGRALRDRCEGYTLGVLTTPELGSALGFPGLDRPPILNGGIDCDFVTGCLDDDALVERSRGRR